MPMAIPTAIAMGARISIVRLTFPRRTVVQKLMFCPSSVKYAQTLLISLPWLGSLITVSEVDGT